MTWGLIPLPHLENQVQGSSGRNGVCLCALLVNSQGKKHLLLPPRDRGCRVGGTASPIRPGCLSDPSSRGPPWEAFVGVNL